MSAGVLYFNHGERCLVRLLVSIYTLRRYYNGPVALAAEGMPPDWVIETLGKLKVDIIYLPICHDYGLVKKSRLWRKSPFEFTMFLDSDTVILKPVDGFFDWIKSHGLVVTKFCGWSPGGSRMRARIRQWKKVDRRMTRKALRYSSAINTGVQGWRSGDDALIEYERLTAAGIKARVGKKTLDEIAMQLVITKHKHKLVGEEWNDSCMYGNPGKARILHYHGHKHCRDNVAGDIWKQAFWLMLDDFPEIRDTVLSDPRDDSIRLWLKKDARPAAYRRDLTIVTAVNPAYASVAAKNFALWADTPGLKEQDFIVFVNGFKNAKERKFIDVLPNCKIVRWEYPFDTTPRETMLAAFVLGVPEHVSTPYWCKLDADCTPTLGSVEWPVYSGHTITSHRWGYTKMKGDPEATEHWFNRLDKTFSPNMPLFPKLDPVKDLRVSHRKGNRLGIPMRFGSFYHVERTSFTRRIADVIKRQGGRLPIPSQDTISWYCAYLWKEPMKLINMKGLFKP